MLTEREIQEALHASRVVPLAVPNPHGPLGLDHVAEAVAQIAGSPLAPPERGRIRRPLSLSAGAWEKLDQLAAASAQTASRPVSASEVASAILEQVLAAPSPQ
jgi:hypothetical protein